MIFIMLMNTFQSDSLMIELEVVFLSIIQNEVNVFMYFIPVSIKYLLVLNLNYVFFWLHTITYKHNLCNIFVIFDNNT